MTIEDKRFPAEVNKGQTALDEAWETGGDPATKAVLPMESTAKNYHVTPENARRILSRYVPAPGKIIGIREIHAAVLSRLRTEDGTVGEFKAEDVRRRGQMMFGGWLVVLMCGPDYVTDYGQVVRRHPLLVPGARMLIGRTPPEEIDLAVGGGEVTLGMANFRTWHLIDRGPDAEDGEPWVELCDLSHHVFEKGAPFCKCGKAVVQP